MVEAKTTQKAGIYIRVSTDEQAEKGTSLASQEERIREYCARQGIPVAGVYMDDGYSGATMDRPGLQRLLHDAHEGVFNLALVYKLDRLSRNLKDAINLVLGELESCGVGFQSVTEPFQTLEPAGKMMFANLASFADYEREQIRERCYRGRLMRNREGKFTGGRLPYGIGWDKEKKAFFIVEKEARIYRRIFEMFVKEGKSTGQIVSQLTADGAITRDGVPISADHVRLLLRSPAACGEWHRHRIINKAVVDPRLQRKFDAPCYMQRNRRPREEWITIQIPAIIPRATWERVQGMRQSKRQPQNHAPVCLCQGVIFCGECGRRVGVSRAHRGKKVYRRYGCTARIYHMDKRYRHYRSQTCDMPFFPVGVVDEQVWARIENLVENPASLWEAIHLRHSKSGREVLTQRRIELTQQLGHAKAQEDRAARLYTMGAAPQTAEQQVREATARRRALEQELDQLGKAIRAEKGYQESKELAYDLLMSLRGKMDSLTLEEKRRVLHRLVPGGLTHRLELQADGFVDINGIIDFATETQAMSMPYSGVSYLK